MENCEESKEEDNFLRTVGNDQIYKKRRKLYYGIKIYRTKYFPEDNIKINDDNLKKIKKIQEDSKNKNIKKGVSIIGFIPIKEKINKKAQNGQVADEEEKFLVQELNNTKTKNYIAKEIIKKLKTKHPEIEKFKFNKIGGMNTEKREKNKKSVIKKLSEEMDYKKII